MQAPFGALVQIYQPKSHAIFPLKSPKARHLNDVYFWKCTAWLIVNLFVYNPINRDLCVTLYLLAIFSFNFFSFIFTIPPSYHSNKSCNSFLPWTIKLYSCLFLLNGSYLEYVTDINVPSSLSLSLSLSLYMYIYLYIYIYTYISHISLSLYLPTAYCLLLMHKRIKETCSANCYSFCLRL